ncbi:MAG: chorismate-binding protein [Flavobacteriaceae bacterium]|nr:chorismate-binding protein [Flavobacteriaceae bacterium]
MKKLKERIAKALEIKRPFVICRKPNAKFGEAVFQQDNSTYFSSDFSENGFVFAPFNSNEKTLLIPLSTADKFSFKLDDISISEASEIKNNTSETERIEHEKLVQKGIDFINASDVDKVVLSRKELVKVDDCDVFEIYQNLIINYPKAYVYLWFHPVSGLWMGATPELLISTGNQQFKIMALASTQEYNGTLDVNWNEKELQEHQFVIDYIASQLADYKLQVSDTYTVKAGNLVHLRADISGEIDAVNFNLSKLIKTLHPTSATCGLPKEKAKEFILKNEHYNREYYTGFLGEINDSKTELYVNLRCMKIEIDKQQVLLYIGGGITKDSNPKKEWFETVAKAKVMKKVLWL